MLTLNCRIALEIDRHIGSTAAEVPVKFQSDRTILNTNLAASRLYEILRKDVFSDIETGPWIFGLDRESQLLGLTLNMLVAWYPKNWGYPKAWHWSHLSLDYHQPRMGWCQHI